MSMARLFVQSVFCYVDTAVDCMRGGCFDPLGGEIIHQGVCRKCVCPFREAENCKNWPFLSFRPSGVADSPAPLVFLYSKSTVFTC